jgi:hypothetical protein
MGLIILLVLLSLWLWGGRISRFQSLYSAPKLYQVNKLPLQQNHEVKQDFLADYPGLSQVDIFLTGSDGPTITLTLHIRTQCEAADDLRTAVANQPSEQSDDRAMYSFLFTPIDTSANGKFCFILAPTLLPEQDQDIGLLASQIDVYPQGRLFYEIPDINLETKTNVPQPALEGQYQNFLPLLLSSKPDDKNTDLAFQLHYNGPVIDTLSIFLERLAEYKPMWFGQGVFYILLFLMYCGGILWLVRLITSVE